MFNCGSYGLLLLLRIVLMSPYILIVLGIYWLFGKIYKNKKFEDYPEWIQKLGNLSNTYLTSAPIFSDVIVIGIWCVVIGVLKIVA